MFELPEMNEAPGVHAVVLLSQSHSRFFQEMVISPPQQGKRRSRTRFEGNVLRSVLVTQYLLIMIFIAGEEAANKVE